MKYIQSKAIVYFLFYIFFAVRMKKRNTIDDVNDRALIGFIC